MQWMEIAWGDVGIAEIDGPQSNPAILAMFADVGRADITNEATAWCGAYLGSVMVRAGLPLALTPDRRIVARAYLELGRAIEAPRVGAVAVLKRDGGEPWNGHVGFVTGWTATHIMLLGGNQANSVKVSAFPIRDVIGYRWIGPEASEQGLAAAGSRTVKEARGATGEIVVAAGTMQLPGLADLVADLSAVGQQAQQLKGALGSLVDFASWSVTNAWPGLALVGAFFAARAFVRMRRVIVARVEDASTGANTGRPA